MKPSTEIPHDDVVVVGMGVVCPIARDVDEFREALRRGDSGHAVPGNIEIGGFPQNIACPVEALPQGPWSALPEYQNAGRAARMAIIASWQALKSAGVDPKSKADLRVPVIVGTTDGEAEGLDRLGKWVATGNLEDVVRSRWMDHDASRLALSVSRAFRFRGGAWTMPTACSAGNYAIGHAYDLIRTGEADMVLCGGAESLSRKAFAGFMRMGAISSDLCRPFERDRQGILIGEGSGMLLLESRASATARGATVLARIMGYGMSCDASHPVSPERNSIANCIRAAHRNAGVEPRQVGYVSAHGTGTRANDATESGSLLDVFGEHIPPTSSIKSMLGHTMGAASALSAISCVLAMREECLPPTVHFRNEDPECPLDCVPNEARGSAPLVVQNNAFAVFGNNCIVLLGKGDVPVPEEVR